MNRDQFKHLQSRLEAAARTLRNDYKRPPKPADVAQAERTVSAWEKHEEKLDRAHRNKVDSRVCTAREALYFDDPTKALAAVKKLETEAAAVR
jgi:hypothetical protein